MHPGGPVDDGAASEEVRVGERAVGEPGRDAPPVEPVSREWWGYAVWGVVLVAILVPEIWAAATTQKTWPTISATVGHLEYRWDWIGLIVVGVGVWVAVSVISYPAGPRQVLVRQETRPDRRTACGRATMHTETGGALPAVLVPVGAALVALASVLTATLDPSDPYTLGDVLYGTIAIFCAAAPSIVAYVWARDVAFPTFFRTLANLERRVPYVSVLVLAGLGILLFHLALYPWPNVFHVLHGPSPGAP
jgi:hypothetical protein